MSKINEVQNAYSALTTFLQNQSAYVSTGGTPPDPNQLASNFVFDELVTFCSTNADEEASFITGIAQEAGANNAAILREINMATTSKAQIFSACIAESNDDAQFYSQNQNFIVGVFNGNPTSGSQC